MIGRPRFNSVRILLLTGAALFGWVEPALAQDSNPSGEQQDATVPTDAADIIVTAQRRSERLQDVPISIQTLSANTLANQSITSVRDLTTAIPGFNLTVKGAFALPTLRGVSSQGTAAGLDPAIPIYLDGVYQSNTIATIFELSDISNIEVLKGPQGTLYGRNATGGAILITTRKPSFDFGGGAALSYGTYNDWHGSAHVTGGLVPDLLAFSLSGDYHRRDGYIRDLIGGGKIGKLKGNTLRGKLLLTPSPAVEITLSGMHSFLDDPAQLAGVPLGGNTLSKLVAPALPITTVPFTIREDVYPLLKTRSDQISLNVDIDTGIGQFTSVSAYQNSLAQVRQDADGGPGAGLSFTYRLPNKAYSQEASFASEKFGAFSLLAGGLYFKQDVSGRLVANGRSDILGTQHIEAYAVYGELTVEPVANLTLVGGLRYSHEHRDYVGQLATVPNPYVTIAVGSKSWSDVTPRLTAKYRITPSLNVYASYNKAFKSGVFNPSGLVSTPVDPENGIAYEVGAKFASGNIHFNVAGFKYDFTDLQVATTITRPDGTTSSFLENAAGAKIKGFDFDADVELVKGLTLSGGFSYIDGKYTNFTAATVNAPIPAAGCPAGTFPCGNTSVSVDATGNALVRSPKFSGNVTAQYSTEVSSGTVTGSVSFYHSASFAWEASGRLRQPSYNTLAATVRWKSQTGFEISVYGRNLTNEIYANNLADSAGGDLVNYALPRTVGVKVGYSF